MFRYSATSVEFAPASSKYLEKELRAKKSLVKNWCSELIAVINTQLDTEEESKLENEEKTSDEYLDLQDQIISGSLPCSKDDAALFAAIQLSVEENWPGKVKKILLCANKHCLFFNFCKKYRVL